MNAIFRGKLPLHREYRDQKCRIISRGAETFVIQFADGYRIDAWPEELRILGTNSGGPGAPTQVERAAIPNITMACWNPDDPAAKPVAAPIIVALAVIALLALCVGLYATQAPSCRKGGAVPTYCAD